MRGISKYFLEVIDMNNFLDKPVTWKVYALITGITVLCNVIAYIITLTDVVDHISFMIHKKR